MSRVGKNPVLVPAGVTAKLDGHTVAVKGAKGELKFTAPEDVTVKIEGNLITVDPRGDRPPPSITPIDVTMAPHIQDRRVGP